jgi:hypothetical protein
MLALAPLSALVLAASLVLLIVAAREGGIARAARLLIGTGLSPLNERVAP